MATVLGVNLGTGTVTMDNYNTSELYIAMNDNDVGKMKQLLASGYDVNEFYYDAATDDAVSLLHITCTKDRLDCVQLLLDGQAIMDVADQFGRTPLMYALSNHCLNCAQLLLQKHHELASDEDSNGFTALDLSAIDGNVDAVRLLSQYGADMNHQTFDGETPLIRCIKIGLVKDRAPVIRALVECGADVNMKDRKCRRSALQLASLKMDVKSVEVLLSVGADMYSLDIGAKTPLTNMILQHVRMKNGAMFVHEDIWTILLMMVHSGIDFNNSICEDADPLMTAALLKSEALVRFFLSYGANPNIQTRLGVAALLKAVSRNDLPSVKALVEWNCRLDLSGQHYRKREDIDYTVDPYELSILLGYLNISKFMVQAGYPHYHKPYLFQKAPLPKSLECDLDFLFWLKGKCLNPEPLCRLAMFAVRRAVGLDIVRAARQLPIPPSLKRMITLKDLLELDVDF